MNDVPIHEVVHALEIERQRFSLPAEQDRRPFQCMSKSDLVADVRIGTRSITNHSVVLADGPLDHANDLTVVLEIICPFGHDSQLVNHPSNAEQENIIHFRRERHDDEHAFLSARRPIVHTPQLFDPGA